jgi:16S rRNA (cytidine1402-2'-O)-methyltransferase
MAAVLPSSSTQTLKPGLYVIATPIGHLDDLTARARQILMQVDWLYAEDSRETQRLLQGLGLSRPSGRLRSLHAHNEAQQIPEVLALLGQSLRVGLVSDAGTPGISDPGARLVQAVWEAGFRVSPVPGASAVIAAASVSGFLTDAQRPLSFWGFLPARSVARRSRYEEIRAHAGVSVCFEAPHRIHASLQDAESVLGDRCTLMLCREMTKAFERMIRGTPAQVREQLAADLSQDPRSDQGEMVLVIDPEPVQAQALTEEQTEDWRALLGGRLPKPRAAKLLAQALGLSRDEAYALLLPGAGDGSDRPSRRPSESDD